MICCTKLRINGIVTHELGCDQRWRDTTRSCKWCGSNFIPEYPNQRCCEDSCFYAYNDMPDPNEIELND